MRCISVAAVCLLAASSNVYAVPLGQDASFAARQASVPAAAPAAADASEALSIPSLGKIASGLSIGSALLPFAQGILGSIFGGNSSSRRDLEELEQLLKREGYVVARQDAGSADESGAFNFLDILNALFPRSDNEQRDFVSLPARAPVEEESGAFKLPSLGQVANGASIASSAATIIKDIFGSFGNSTKRDQVMASLQNQNATATSGALDLGSLLSGLVSDLPGLLAGLLKRDDANESLSTIFSQVQQLQKNPAALQLLLGNHNSRDVVARGIFDELKKILSNPVPGQGKRDFSIGGLKLGGLPFNVGTTESETVNARAVEAADDDESGALKLGGIAKTLGSLGSIAFSGLGILGDLFPSNSTARREFVEILARAPQANDDASGAISLQNIANAAKQILEGIL